MSSGNLFYASDKAIYDALLQHQFTNSDLKDIFLSRGILVSCETDRDKLAKYFCRLNHDYYDHQMIASVLGVGNRREKSSITNVKNKFDNDSLEKAVTKIKEEQQSVGDVAEIKFTNKGIELRFIYTHIDYNKSEFKQVIEKEAIITIEHEEDELNIRWPSNDYVEDIKERLLDSLSKSDCLTDGLKVEEIELTNIESPEKRTEFFNNLIHTIGNFKLLDVTDVYVYHPKISKDEEKIDIGVHIFKASLKGEGVLISEELASLYKKGFYIWKISWLAKEDSYDADLYELEAQFSDAENCKKFSYLVRGAYKYKTNGEHNKSKSMVSSLEEVKLFRLIENAARHFLDKIQKPAQVEDKK